MSGNSDDQNFDDYFDETNQTKNRIPYQIYHRSSSAILNNQSLGEQPEDLYVFVKFLGRGSFGSVNLYRYTKENTLVAWKEIDLNAIEPQFRNEINSEIGILASLDHPNIISYYKHFTGENCLYIELEYANGGTLMHLIKQQKVTEQYFSEETVIWYLYQIISAVDYIHDQQILHRDIKSLNIFSTKAGLLKLGDFGLAKRLENNDYANTQVGTPHYMAPEILSGNAYDSKSDIWSVGCVLYEVLTLRKVFDATNQLKLAMRILNTEVNDDEIQIFSSEMKFLVKKMLEKNSELRPSAKEILDNKLFKDKLLSFENRIDILNNANKKSKITSSSSFASNNNSMYESLSSYNDNSIDYPIIASKLSESYIWGGGKQIPQILETFKRENAPLQVCVGLSHYAVITVEKELYTWAISQGGSRSTNNAKLGLGKNSGLSRVPRLVESFNGIFVKQVACGEDFTLCVSDDGTLYTFGTNYCGCLGISQDDYEILNDNEDISDSCGSIFKPIPIPFFHDQSIKISKVACGDSHVVCLTENNEVYTWGNGEFGRLGHGDENDIEVPRKLNFRLKYTFKNVFAGPDCTFLVTNKGKVIAFGNNEYNKLGLNYAVVGVKKKDNKEDIKISSDIMYQLTPKLVKSLINYKIYKISCGSKHTAAIDSYGRLITFGNNKYGQLGIGDCKIHHNINVVGGALTEHHVINVACGDTFTICATQENHVFSWGNCKDGRLGLDLTFNRDDANFICSPRPIFGSLYIVSDMCSKYWNSIIIAEKILDAKALRSISHKSVLSSNSTTQMNSIDSDYETFNNFDKNEPSINIINEKAQKPSIFDNIPHDSQINQSITSSNIPDWLKNDLEDAEYIPIDVLKINNITELSETSTKTLENGTEKTITTLEEALEVIKRLQEEILILKEENMKLKMENNTLKIT